jgi:glycerol-3-phosphate dehydrogenase (NAD(P)+)
MSKILIIGAGVMASAFSIPCADKGHEVTIIGTHLENEFIDKITSNDNLHPVFLTQIPKNVKYFKFEKLAGEIKKEIDLIVLGVNSKGLEWASNEIGKFTNNKIPILMLTKGLSVSSNKYELLVDKLKSLLDKKGFKEANISIVGGPCLAGGLANRVHSSVIIANSNLDTARWLKNLLSADYYHISITNDVIGVEVCSAIKNIYSMVIGASEGLCSKQISNKYKEINYLNTAASVMRQSIYEMQIFTKFLNGKSETVIGLAGLGDLYVSSAGGRNSKIGKFIGHGMTFSEAKNQKMKNVTIEGADLAFEIGTKVKKDFDIQQLPLMISMINTICDNKKLNIEWDNFKENKNE